MKKKNISMKKKIDKLTYNQKFEIYNILISNNSLFSENNNGIFFNLKYLNKQTLELIESFLEYSKFINTSSTDNKNHKLQTLEKQYTNYSNTNTNNIINKTATAVTISENMCKEEDYILYDINNETYKKDLQKTIKLDILQINNKDEQFHIYSNMAMDTIDTNEGDIEGDDDNETEENNNDETIIDEDDNDDDDETNEEEHLLENIENILDEETYEELEEDVEKKNEVSSKKKFTFKHYIKKLNLQSKKMLPKKDYLQNTLNTSNISHKLTLNSSSLSGSTYRIFNICKNIHKNNDFSIYNTKNTTSELPLE